MGFRDAIAGLLGLNTPYETIVFEGPTVSEVLGMSPEQLYRTQPHFQTVVSFLARNVAHLGLPAYERKSDTDRGRYSGQLTQLLAHPNPSMTGYELREALVSDLGVYDIAYWLWGETDKTKSGWLIQPIPPSWVVETRGGSAFAPASYVVQNPDGTRESIPAENMLVFHGWNPGKPKRGSAPVDALKNVLAEQIQAWDFRQQLWKRGGRVGAYLSRPKDAPAWSGEARAKFKRDWQEFSGRGAKAGSTPLLEDGLELKRVGFSAREEQWLDAAKLSLQTVASIYHVNPVMVGILDNANFSNTKEFRKMLYSETLGPVLKMVEDRLNTFLVPAVTGRDDVYVEFNIQAKLAGDFEEQAAVLSTSTGGPWMTRNEARARQNLPAIEGADELIVPLNVIEGGQASPRDSGTQNLNAQPMGLMKARVKGGSVKSADVDTDEHQKAIADVLSKFYDRQKRAVLSVLSAKADADWWDEDRWNDELAADLYAEAVRIAAVIGMDQAVALGFRAGDYDEDRTTAFLTAVAQSRATAVNTTTRERIQKALDEGDDPAGVFDEAQSARVESGSTAFATFLAGFALVEAGKQLAPERATKTWVVQSRNPRAEHAAMHGETVPIEGTFSNGANWPGDPVLGAEGVANCMCGVNLVFP